MVMTQEGTANAKRWGGWEVKELGITAKTTTNSEERYLGYPPFVRSLRRYLIRKHNRNWNRNHNLNQWSRRNTNRRTRSTATGNHTRRRKISNIRGRGRGGVICYEKEEDECEDIIEKEVEETYDLSLLFLLFLLIYAFDIV